MLMLKKYVGYSYLKMLGVYGKQIMNIARKNEAQNK